MNEFRIADFASVNSASVGGRVVASSFACWINDSIAATVDSTLVLIVIVNGLTRVQPLPTDPLTE